MSLSHYNFVNRINYHCSYHWILMNSISEKITINELEVEKKYDKERKNPMQKE